MNTALQLNYSGCIKGYFEPVIISIKPGLYQKPYNLPESDLLPIATC
jgi:hypothetical protein